ncbi:MAG: VanZ family protein [Clostridia bacterium]|nr:VanZ family protein [Clostridia bacterium]
MPVFMICAFVLCAYMISLQMLADNPRVGGTPSQRRVLLLAVTGVLLGVLLMCCHALGSSDEVLMLLTLLLPCAAVYLGLQGLRRHADALNRPMTVLFILSVLAVCVVTLFSRDGTSSTKVLFGLYKVQQAIATGSLQPLGHVVQNIVLFLPFGFLLTAACPGKRGMLLMVVAYGLLFSTAIESLQYLLSIGECDLEDILANVLGAAAGSGLMRLFVRTR